MPSQPINDGTDSSRRQSGRSTCCVHADSTPSCKPTLTRKVTTTTIASPLSPWYGAPLCYFEDPERRASWAYHGIEGFAIGPAPEHYRCTTCWIPSTGTERISDTIMMFHPTHMTLPSLPTQEETVNEAARELGRALQQMATNNPAYSHLGTYAGLKKLTDIVHSVTTQAKAQRVEKEQLQRVSTEQPSPERAHPNAHAIPFDNDEVAQPQRVPYEGEPRPAPRPTRQLHDPVYNKPILPSTHRYPTRRKALNILLQQHNIQPPPVTPPPSQPNVIQHTTLLHQCHLGRQRRRGGYGHHPT
ncbi:hypothetical protein ACHAWF_001922 [Thalassiosira exigua]